MRNLCLLKMAPQANINKILVMLDPTTFPATISGTPSYTDITDEISSGKDVPIDTTVTPITICEIRK